MINYVIYILVSLLMALLYYFSSPNIAFAIVVGVLFLALFVGLYETLRKKYDKRLNRTLEAIKFINNFTITLSVNNSISTTYNAVIESSSKELKLQADTIKQFDIEERIGYLNKYFDCPIYGVFINLIKQYTYNGGNILDISQLLIHDSRELEERINDYEFNAKRKTRDFLISWGFSVLILIIMRSSLKQTITNFDNSLPSYPLLVFGYFFIVVFVAALYFYKRFDYTFIFKGVSKNEKSKRENIKVKTKSKKWVD